MTKIEIPLIVVVIGFPSSRQATNALKSGELFSSLRSSKLGWMECVRQNRWIQIAHQFPPLSSETVFTNICCSCYWCWCCRYQQSYRRSPSSCWLSTIPSWLSDTLCILHKQKHSVSLSSLRCIMLSWINLDFYRMNIQDDKDLVTSLKEMFQTHFREWWHILQLLGHRLSLFPHVFFAPSHQINISTSLPIELAARNQVVAPPCSHSWLELSWSRQRTGAASEGKKASSPASHSLTGADGTGAGARRLAMLLVVLTPFSFHL